MGGSSGSGETHASQTPSTQGATSSISIKWIAGAALMLGLGWLGWGWSGGVPLALQPGDYLNHQRQRNVRDLLSVTSDFGFSRSVIIGLSPKQSDDEDVFSGRMLKLNRRLTRRLARHDGVASVLSIPSSQAISKEQGALVVRPMLAKKQGPISLVAQRRLRKQVLGDPLLRGSLVSEDADLTLLLVQLKAQKAAAFNKTVQRIIALVDKAAHKHRFAHISLTGQPVIGPMVAGAAAKDGRAFGPIALALFVLFLVIGLAWRRGLGAVAMMLLATGIAALACWGLFGAVFAHNAWLLLLAWWFAGIWWFRQERWSTTPAGPRGPSDPSPLSDRQRRLAAIGVASLAGLALLLAPGALFQRMGWAAWSAGLALIAASTLFGDPAPPSGRARWIQTSTLAGGLWWLVIFVMGFGIFHLQTGGLLEAIYPKGSRLTLGEQLQRKHFGGAAPLLIRFRGDLRDPTALKAVERLSRRLEAHHAIFGPQSIAGLIRQLNSLLNTWPRVPDESKQINALWMFLEGQPALKSLVRKQGKDAILQARVRIPRGWDAARVLHDIKQMTADMPQRYRTVTLASLPPKAQQLALKRRIPWIEEGLALWLQRHSGLEVPQRLASTLHKVVAYYTLSAQAPPPKRPLSPLRLRKKLHAYITSEDCDLELKKPQQRTLLVALIQQNRRGTLLQPGVLNATLLRGLKGSPAAKDKDSIKYAMRALVHILRQLHKQQHLEQFQRAIFKTFKNDRGFLQRLSKALRKKGHTSPRRRMAELHAELMEAFSTTTFVKQPNAKGPPEQTLTTTVTGIPGVMLPLQRDAQRNLTQSIAALVIAALLVLLLFLRRRLSVPRVIASLLLMYILALGAMGLYKIPLHLPTSLILALLGVLSLSVTVPIALTPPSQRSYQHMIKLCLWLSMPFAPFLFASLPVLQHVAALLFVGPWLATAAAVFTHREVSRD